MLGRIDGAQTAPDHLDHGRFVGTRPQQHDAGGRRVVPALGQHRDIDDDADSTGGIGVEDPLALSRLERAGDERGRDARLAERLRHMLGMGDGRAEDDGLSIARLFLPMADHLVGDRRAVHDLRHLGHVVIRHGLADRAQLVLHAHVDDEGPRRHEVAGGDQLAQPDLVGDVVEDLAQALPVAPVGRRRDAEDPGLRIGVAHPVDDAAVALGHSVMRLVDDQQIELRHGREIGGPRQRRRHGEGDLALPGLGRWRRRRRWRCPGLTRANFARFWRSARHDARAHKPSRRRRAAAGDGGEHDLARARGCYAQRVVAGRERSQAALHEEFLAGKDTLCSSPLRPGRVGPAPAMLRAAGPAPAGAPSARAAGSRAAPPAPSPARSRDGRA